MGSPYQDCIDKCAQTRDEALAVEHIRHKNKMAVCNGAQPCTDDEIALHTQNVSNIIAAYFECIKKCNGKKSAGKKAP